MRRCGLTCTLLATLTLTPGLLSAQSVRGLGDDALTAPRGAIRVQFSTSITDFSQRYGKGTPGRPDGSLEPLGQDFSIDSLGVAQFPGLAAAETALRSLTGNAGFRLTLGRSVLTSSVRTQTTPIALEAGLTNWLSIGVMVPIVSARKQVSFNLNSRVGDGNVGANPARFEAAAADTNARLVNQMTAARAAFVTRYDGCVATPSGTGCAQVLASGAELIGNAQTFIQNLQQVYGTTRGAGAAFVPVVGSAADSIIRTRVTNFRTQYERFGVTSLLPATVGPRRAATMTPATLQRAIADTTLGLLAAPFGTVTHQGLGDIEVAVKLRLFDSFGLSSDTVRFQPRGLNFRQSVAGVYRLGTGSIDDPDDYLDIGTGQGQNDVELRSFTDITYGRKFFASLIARYTVQLADEQERRITDRPEDAFAPAYRQRLVSRDLGDQLEVEITPRWILSDFFSIGAQYLIRNKAEDSYSGQFQVPISESGLSSPLVLDASTLRFETAELEQRVGFGMTFSSVASHARGKAKLPIEVQYFNSRTVSGSGGAVSKLSIHQLQIRLYPRR